MRNHIIGQLIHGSIDIMEPHFMGNTGCLPWAPRAHTVLCWPIISTNGTLPAHSESDAVHITESNVCAAHALNTMKYPPFQVYNTLL